MSIFRAFMFCVLAVALAGAIPALAADVYKVNVTRKDQDLYAVQGGKIYIKTRYCYEYVYSDDAILRIDNPNGFNVGKIFFSGGASCDVEKVLS